MNKSDLIDAISATTSLTKRESEDAVNALVHAVVSEVRGGRRVVVSGFGSFNPTQRGARMGRNPQTGAPVRIAASKGVRFAPSSTLKAIVNGKLSLPAPKTSLKKTAGKSTTTPARRASADTSPGGPVPKIVRRSPATQAAKRAPARKRAKRSANKAVRRAPANSPAKRAPARKAAKRSAKKAVRRA